jgi:hypothetical protein
MTSWLDQDLEINVANAIKDLKNLMLTKAMSFS